mmetsp:Transcript_15319/g.32433  ORF Transcript_15319/g.32433 Transcript_15319/m.32433 type:complete len:106 (-) Transcript_15319:513-830(-)
MICFMKRYNIWYTHNYSLSYRHHIAVHRMQQCIQRDTGQLPVIHNDLTTPGIAIKNYQFSTHNLICIICSFGKYEENENLAGIRDASLMTVRLNDARGGASRRRR